MAVKASNQITLIDLTDGYSVVLTNESHTFLGTTTSVSGSSLTIQAGDVANQANYTVQLEG